MRHTDNKIYGYLSATSAVNKKRITFCPEHPGMGKLAVVLRITNTPAILQIQLVTRLTFIIIFNRPTIFTHFRHVNKPHNTTIMQLPVPENVHPRHRYSYAVHKRVRSDYSSNFMKIKKEHGELLEYLYYAILSGVLLNIAFHKFPPGTFEWTVSTSRLYGLKKNR